ncbi:MAG: GDP-L-fucose synthase [Chromatiaceae bacterium]|nr:MAG: GDP-L-fucose synthase [Chromatiaceae bacterium]
MNDQAPERRPRIFVAGHRGMVGAAICRRLQATAVGELITRTRAELDLTEQTAVRAFFAGETIDQVYLAAAQVGGIHANATYPAAFIYRNLMIEANLIEAAHAAGVPRLLFLGSSCIYPREAPQPIPEEALLTGPLEPTNEPYAIAKIAGIKLCESYQRQHDRDYRSVMPTNLYGPEDNFHPTDSHVIPALLRRFHQAVRSDAPEVVIWGSGRARREFLHVDDMAAACIHVMNLERVAYAEATSPQRSHLNVGTGSDCSIAELAATIARVTGFRGRIRFDTERPDGAPRKLLDCTRLTRLGWQPSIDLETGLSTTYQWFVANQHRYRGCREPVAQREAEQAL